MQRPRERQPSGDLVRQENLHIAAADERRGAGLLEHDLCDAQKNGHDGHTDAESCGEHGAADWVCRERPDRQPSDHRVISCSIRPSFIVSTRRARPARSGSCVTTTSAVPSGVDAVEQQCHLFPGCLVEFASGLVREQQARMVGERPRDGDTLHFAAGQLRRTVISALGEAHVLEQLEAAAASIVSGHTGLGLRQFHVLGGRQHREEIEALKNKSDLPQAQHTPRPVVERRDVLAVEDQRPG